MLRLIKLFRVVEQSDNNKRSCSCSYTINGVPVTWRNNMVDYGMITEMEREKLEAKYEYTEQEDQ